MTEQARRPEKKRMARAFGNAVSSYDDVAVLQRDTADKMLQRLDEIHIQPEYVLDLGTGTGRNLSLLQRRYPAAQQIAVDIAAAMLLHARQRYCKEQAIHYEYPAKPSLFIAGDAEQLPLADNSMDLVYANLSLQWCDLAPAYQEIQRILRPDGLLMFSTLGPATLQELRQCWATVDDYPHINTFLSMQEVEAAMVVAGFTNPVLDSNRQSLWYNDMVSMMRDLQQLGARNVNQGRRRGLTGKSALKTINMTSEQFRENGKLPATYEVIYGLAWAGGEPRQFANDSDSINVELERHNR